MIARMYVGQDPMGYWMSERLDGWHVWWTGSNFLTRDGEFVEYPSEILDEIPNVPLDGVLWCGRQNVDQCHRVVSLALPTMEQWSNVTFCVMDSPLDTFTRHGLLNGRLMETEYCRIIPQVRCLGRDHFQEFFDRVILDGGKGVMLRAWTSIAVLME